MKRLEEKAHGLHGQKDKLFFSRNNGTARREGQECVANRNSRRQRSNPVNGEG
jgi:hypothetical protein